MKRWKKLMALALALCMASGMTGFAAYDANAPLPFQDVAADAWYHDAVQYTYQSGLMSGTSAKTFAPAGSMTRAMFVQVLYNAAGKPKTAGKSPFTDVKKGTWYYNAVVWAANEQITAGTGEKTFSPDAAVTREQLVTLFHHYAGSPGDTWEVTPIAPGGANISLWAYDAMMWAYEHCIIQGDKNGTLAPRRTATRAEAAAILSNYFKNGKPTDFTVEQTAKIVLRSGHTGKRIEITDQESLQQICTSLPDTLYGGGWNSSTGWSYALTFVDGQGNILDEIVLRSNRIVICQDTIYQYNDTGLYDICKVQMKEQ